MATSILNNQVRAQLNISYSFVPYPGKGYEGISDCLQILVPISSEFKRINELLLPLKSLENLRFSDDFWGE